MSLRAAALACAVSLAPPLASAGSAEDAHGYRSYQKAATYETVREDLKDAIVNRGFVVDYVGHFNAMLERTAEAVGSKTPSGIKSPFKNAEYLQFCPAQLTHEAVSASPLSIANCPVAVFVYELNYEPGKVHVGFRLPVGSPSRLVKQVNDKLTTLLDEIAKEATKP